MTGFIIGFFVASIVFFLGFIFLSKCNYFAKYKMKYNMRNMFPYEFNFKNTFSDNVTGNLCLIIYSCLSLAFYVLSLQEGFIINNYYVALIACGINVVMTSSLVFIPLNAVRLHLGVGIISLVSSFASFGALGYITLTDFQTFESIPSLIIAIISLVFCLIYFAVCMNPKLNAKINYETEVKEDGSTIYKRPKFFVLAFSEWLSIFSNLILMILLLIFVLI